MAAMLEQEEINKLYFDLLHCSIMVKKNTHDLESRKNVEINHKAANDAIVVGFLTRVPTVAVPLNRTASQFAALKAIAIFAAFVLAMFFKQALLVICFGGDQVP